MTDHAITLEEIEAALHAGELCFYFQPKISFQTGRIVGGEALLRWKKDDGTLIAPGAFLPLAEKTGFITDITAVMMTELAQDIARLRVLKPDIQIAFNVSALDLHSPYLVKMLRSFIGNKLINPGNIQIEITETALVDQNERIHATLLDLVALGIEIVMDDFGTGYSSLDVLSQLPFSALKLDQGVVGRMPDDSKNTHIVRSSLQMARELSIKTIAEGVETEAVYTFLLASGCNEAQGFWMSRPQPIEDFIKLVEQDPEWPSSELGFLYNAWVNHLSYRRKVLDTVYTMTMSDPSEWSQLPKLDLRHSPAHCRLGQWYRDLSRAGGIGAQPRCQQNCLGVYPGCVGALKHARASHAEQNGNPQLGQTPRNPTLLARPHRGGRSPQDGPFRRHEQQVSHEHQVRGRRL